ncbi:hypothetical protein GCM10009123_09030 [Kangiella japonica]|uniref:DUF4381 domain-containing protein n=2 Tax=Kangiella japonica TaxID=647384 RepID=A0ABN0SWN4_9GAMM
MQAVKLPVTVSSAAVIVALCFLVYSWTLAVRDYHAQEFTVEYSQGLANASASFLGHLIEDEDTDTLSTVGQQLQSDNAVTKLSIYRRNGELIYQSGEVFDGQSQPVIANIAFDGNYNGYLIVYFSNSDILPNYDNNFWLTPELIWIFGALIWLILVTLLYAKQWFSPSTKKPQNKARNYQSMESNVQLIKSLIRRKKDHENTPAISSLIIKARWERLNQQSTNTLLRVLNRWLPQNGFFVTQFDNNLLTLGLRLEYSPMNQNPLYALHNCLNQLQLEPKIIVHRLNFGEEIYQTFFDIIDSGIWFEKNLIETGSDYNWSAEKVIDIELEDGIVVELCRLKAPDAEQKSVIERQVRYLSDV